MANTELAARVLELITTKPQLHDQTGWHSSGEADDRETSTEECGTTACVAGWAAIMHYDLKPKVEEVELWFNEGVYYKHSYQPPVGMDWEVAGRRALDIGGSLALDLFMNTNNEEAVGALEDLAAGVDEDEISQRIRDGYYLPE